jgi:hypothetical protein
MSTPRLDALARTWAAQDGYDLTPCLDPDEEVGARHVDSLIAELWEKVASCETHFGFYEGSDDYYEYVEYIESVQRSWNAHIERALKENCNAHR